MRYYGVGLWVAAAAISPLLLACGDDGTGADSTQTTTAAPTIPGTNTDALTSTTNASGNSTGDEPTVGGNSLGTESNGTTEAPPTSDPSTTGQIMPDTTTTNSPSDPSSTTDNPSDPSDSDTDGSTGEPPPPPCVEADCVNMGEYCSDQTGKCEVGCNDDTDCGGMTYCDVGDHTCKGCVVDANCGLGTVCDAGSCVPGCTDNQPCAMGLACCTGQCYDLLVDIDHCGGCDACPAPNNAEPTCINGVCGLGACDANFNNCDNDPNNGCETDDLCACTPNMAVPCYTGPDNTAGVGICKQGMQTCNAQGTGYGDCVGEVTPMGDDICSNNLDDNCNGVVDDNPDADGDGFKKCDECCDSIGPNCLNPDLVNPGAFEVMGNMVDDDCDGTKDNPLPACDAGLQSNSNTPNDYAKAIDLCQFTVENPPQNMKKWGVISTALLTANDGAHNFTEARSIRSGFGTGGIAAQKNTNMVVLSSGNAADQNDINPPYFDFQGSQTGAPNDVAPPTWVAANGGTFPNAPGCPLPINGTTAFDGMNLRIRVRVPTNAKSFSVQMHFMSSEWPEWVCTEYNDLFITLLNSTGMGNPTDKNIAVYKTPQNQLYPVGVNIAKAAPGLFTECQNGAYACFGNGGNYNNCSAGVGPLAGTGMQVTNDAGCGNNNTTGGGTGWLKMSGNVKPGETMEIRFIIWDTGDQNLDSLVMLDAWEWSLNASQPGVTPN